MMPTSQFDFAHWQTQLDHDPDGQQPLQQLAEQLRDFVLAQWDQLPEECLLCATQLADLAEMVSSTQCLESNHELRQLVRDGLTMLHSPEEQQQDQVGQSVWVRVQQQWSQHIADGNVALDGQSTQLSAWALPDGVQSTDAWTEEDLDEPDYQLSSEALVQMGKLLSSLEKDEGLAYEGDTPFQFPEPGEPASSPVKSAAEVSLDEDLKEAFLDDASRCLDSMEKCSLAFERDAGDTNSLGQFCRELHTLKGASASVGLADLASQLHDAESNLGSSSQLPATVIVEQMLQVVDCVRQVVAGLTPTRPNENQPLITVAATDGDVTPNPRLNFSDHSSDESTIRIRASKLDRLMDMLAELVVLRNRRESHISAFAELNDELTRCAVRLSYCADDEHRYESKFMSSSGTLAELSKDISDLASAIRGLQSPISYDNLAISHFIRDFRQELMQLRRIPLSGLFHRIQRSARDAAKSEGKQLQLQMEGADAGLERELQERLFEPLLHIVRNAVSHGIELPNERQQHGKSPVGTIQLSAICNSQMLAITVSDDGRGLDYDAIRRRGIEKGLIGVNQYLSDDELSKLIFHPGFSTRDQASEVSGRGVGMDVVLNTLQQLRGRIEIDSQPARGTTMRIMVPMQTGIEHVMIFRSAGQLFALPMQSISRVKKTVGDRDQNVSMASVLSMPDQPTMDYQNVLILRQTGSPANGAGKRTATDSKAPIGLCVDEILGPEEVVVRKLPALISSHPMFCGLTLSGSAETVLLLDAGRLAQFCSKIEQVQQQVQVAELPPKTAGPARMLVVDDSMSARKLLAMKLTGWGFSVTEAADGLEALEKIRNNQFELIFTDLDMPRLGGLEMLFDLQQGQQKHQRVIVVSSRAEHEFGERALELGAIDYMTKPIQDESLRNILLDLGLIDY